MTLCLKIKVLLVSVLLVLATTLCYPSPQTPAKTVENDSLQSTVRPDPLKNSLDSFTLLLKTVGLVIGFSTMLYFALRWYKKSVYGNSFNKHSSEMKLLGAMSIGPKKTICMVNVLDHVLVLGLTENDMNLLLNIPEADISERLKESLLEEGEQPRNFGKILNQWMKKNTA